MQGFLLPLFMLITSTFCSKYVIMNLPSGEYKCHLGSGQISRVFHLRILSYPGKNLSLSWQE